MNGRRFCFRLCFLTFFHTLFSFISCWLSLLLDKLNPAPSCALLQPLSLSMLVTLVTLFKDLPFPFLCATISISFPLFRLIRCLILSAAPSTRYIVCNISNTFSAFAFVFFFKTQRSSCLPSFRIEISLWFAYQNTEAQTKPRPTRVVRVSSSFSRCDNQRQS